METSQMYLIILEFFMQQLFRPHGISAPQNILSEMPEWEITNMYLLLLKEYL